MAQVFRFVRRGSNIAMSPASPTLEDEFDELAERWHEHTDHLSIEWRKCMHPAYQDILGMGEAAVPFILQRLPEEGSAWFWALEHIARKDHAAGARSIEEALEIWKSWARDKRLI